MAIITPTLQLKANSNAVSTNKGPSSASIALSITKALNVDVLDFWNDTVSVVSADSGNAPAWGYAPDGYNTLVDGSAEIATAVASNSALTGCWIYITNTMASGSELIHIGHTTDSDAASAGDYYTKLTADNLNTRLFSLKAGEFAFFPYDYTGDLYIDASAANQTYEFYRFVRS